MKISIQIDEAEDRRFFYALRSGFEHRRKVMIILDHLSVPLDFLKVVEIHERYPGQSRADYQLEGWEADGQRVDPADVSR